MDDLALEASHDQTLEQKFPLFIERQLHMVRAIGKHESYQVERGIKGYEKQSANLVAISANQLGVESNSEQSLLFLNDNRELF